MTRFILSFFLAIASIELTQQRPLSEIIADLERLIAELKQPPPTPTPTPTPIPTPGVIVVPAGGDIQAALDAAPSGATVALEPGVEYSAALRFRPGKAVTLTTRGWTLPADQRVTREDMPRMATVRTGPENLSPPTFDILPGAADVTIRGVRAVGVARHAIVACGHADDDQVTRELMPQRITLDQLIVETLTTARRGIALHCANASVTNSRIENIHLPGDESAGIGGWNGSGPFTIRNNYIEAASQNVFFGGANPPIPNLLPTDILIEGNVLTKRLDWIDQAGIRWFSRGVGIKNAFELKVGQRVTFRNNVVEHVLADAQAGWAVQLTPSNIGIANALEDITIEGNSFTNIGCAFNILGRGQSNITGQSKRFTIRNNYVQTWGQRYGCSGWFMQLRLGFGEGLVIEHNTIDMLDAVTPTCPVNCYGNQIIVHESEPVVGLRFVGNLVKRSGKYGFSGRARGTNQMRGDFITEYFPSATISGNALGSFPTPSNVPGNLHVPSSAITIENGYGMGTFETYGRRRP